MKRIFLVLSLMFFFVGMYPADITSISNALRNGNGAPLAAVMEQEVDVALPGTSQKCSGPDAITLLNAFFDSNRPTGFTVIHHADKNENGFFVAKLATAAKEYRVNITYRVDQGKAIIQSIRIE